MRKGVRRRSRCPRCPPDTRADTAGGPVRTIPAKLSGSWPDGGRARRGARVRRAARL